LKISRAAVVMLVVAVLALAGCTRRVGATPSPANAPLSVPIGADYPGWTVQPAGVRVANQTVAVADGQVRQEQAVLLLSPSDGTRILASYARSGRTVEEAAARPWKTLDQMYRGDGWKRPDAQALYKQMLADYPQDILLGAYPAPGGSESTPRYYVGFYRESTAGATFSWVRGEHVYELARGSGTWRVVADDGKSGDFWDALVPVP
jgi:hypothetical protein